MKKTATDNIQNGHILAREVCGPSGNILLSKGVELTPAMGRRLKNWDIHFVYIEGEQDDHEDTSESSISPEEFKSGLIEKFSDVIDNPVMKQIFAATLQYKLNRDSE